MTFNINHLIHFKPADVQIFFLSEIYDCYAHPIVIDINQPVRQLKTDACAHRVSTFTNCEALQLLDLMHKRMTDQECSLGKGAKNKNGNLRWHLPLGVRPPPR